MALARANGLPERRVFRHVLKNASIPILTLAGDEFVHLANGQLVVETIFAWPGMGRMVIQAVGNETYSSSRRASSLSDRSSSSPTCWLT